MFSLDHNTGYVLSAFGITVGVLAVYLMYLVSRIRGVERGLHARLSVDAQST